MVTSTARPSYVPDVPPQTIPQGSDAELLLRYITREFAKLSRVDSNRTFQTLQPIHAAPTKPSTGMQVYADGTSWNPGFGEGGYVYTSGGLWVPLDNPTPGQIPGEPSSGSASAGNVGEFISSNIAAASAISISNATPFNLTSITLSPGDWEVMSAIHFVPAATTNVTRVQSGLSIISATLNVIAVVGYASHPFAPFVPGNGVVLSSYQSGNRQTLIAPLQIFCVGQLDFTVSTATAWGGIRAWRRR